MAKDQEVTLAADDGTSAVECVHCMRRAPGATGVFYGGALGEEIRAKICADCWAEWREVEVMVINELRLNFMDAKSQDVLAEHMRKFLKLEDGSEVDQPPCNAEDDSSE